MLCRFFYTVCFVFGLSMPAQAGIFDDVVDALVGHAKDATGRLKEDQILSDAEIRRTATFRSDDAGNDATHQGSGDVSIVRKNDLYFLQFQPNFDSSFAPDPQIYLSKEAAIYDADSFNASIRYKLGALEKGSGASFYAIEGFEPDDISSVTIWCERFGKFITSAAFMHRKIHPELIKAHSRLRP